MIISAITTYMSKKYLPMLYSTLLHKMGNYFLDMWCVQCTLTFVSWSLGSSGFVFCPDPTNFEKFRSDRIRIPASYLSPACWIRAAATWKILERSLIVHILASRNIYLKKSQMKKYATNIISNKPRRKEFNKKSLYKNM